MTHSRAHSLEGHQFVPGADTRSRVLPDPCVSTLALRSTLDDNDILRETCAVGPVSLCAGDALVTLSLQSLIFTLAAVPASDIASSTYLWTP